jgi:ATP-dependent helicase/nuclease subunit A
VLVERYLALLDAYPEWPLGALVAITFTTKAAEEMRDRVRRALEERLYAAAEPDQIDRWTALLAQIDGARINTIHGLCADLLRANAAEAGVDPGFTVLDEFDATVLREDVVDAVLDDLVASGGDELELFSEYPQNSIRETLTNPKLLFADLAALPPNLFVTWQAMWEFATREHVHNFRREVDAIGTVIPAPDDKLGASWQVCLDALDSMVGADSEGYLNALKAIDSINLVGGSYRNWGGKQHLAEARGQLREIRQAARTILDLIGDPPGDLDDRVAELLPLWGSLVGKVGTAYQEAKFRQSCLDFDDLERITRNLFLSNPQVGARYRGVEFKHLLVDEFQDTNAAQWQIIQALADLDTPGSLFVVGDPKQSIYAFRGADVSVFGEVQQQIVHSGGEALPLSRSFRTHQPLVDCFNALFDQLLVRDHSSPVAHYQVTLGKPMTAHRKFPPQPESPAIEVLLIDQYEVDEGQPVLGDNGRPQRLNAEQRRTWEAYEIAVRLKELTGSGFMVYDRDSEKHRRVRYDDMAILFQSLSNVTLYEDVFKAVGLPFVTVAGRGYYSRQEVWDLLNLLQVVYNPADDLALATALRSPLFSLSDDALLALRLQSPIDDSPNGNDSTSSEPLPLWETLADPDDLLPAGERERVAFAHQTLNHLRAIAGRVTISELLREALDGTGYLAVLTGLPDGARRRGNVEKLLEKAHSTGKTTLGEFSQYLYDLSTREAHEGEAPVDVAGAVSVMTVHASKGLEYPVIVLADASWERGYADRDLVILDGEGGLACKVYQPDEDRMTNPFCYRHAQRLHRLRDEAERLRLLYVAMTRAQDYLLVSGQVSANQDGEWRSRGWLDKLLDGLNLREYLAPGTDGLMAYAGLPNILHIHFAQRRPAELTIAGAVSETGWSVQAAPAEPAMPPLLREVAIRPGEQARHLAATQIADLGGARQAVQASDRSFYRERFLRQVFHDAPTHIETVSERTISASARQIGEIVHEALRHWRLPGENDDTLEAMLDSYAWRQGITDKAQRAQAVTRAFKMLADFTGTETYEWLDQAPQVFRELPFIYAHQGHVIHGIIDVLFQTAEGLWRVMDYKTSFVPGDTPDDFKRHARQYQLQLGIYAQAVQEQLGEVIPETYIHYIRHQRTIRVYEEDWRAALAQSIPDRIQDVMRHGRA